MLTIRVEPLPKARPRFGRGRVYTPQDTREYENLIAWETKVLPRFKQPVILAVDFFVSSARGKDLDNLIKSLLDGLQKGGCLHNDSQVIEIHARRIISNFPRIELDIQLFDKPPSEQIE